jgi:hypothetical protein
VPVVLLKNTQSEDSFNCRVVLDNKLSGPGASDAKTGCRCAIAATVFDVFLW